jgi:predicted nucleotidyltransferase
MNRLLTDIAERYHIKQLSLFGSAARGELESNSDIDLLVEFQPGKKPSLSTFCGIAHKLSNVFGNRKVDLHTPSILRNPYRRRSIERDLRVIYAASPNEESLPAA